MAVDFQGIDILHCCWEKEHFMIHQLYTSFKMPLLGVKLPTFIPLHKSNKGTGKLQKLVRKKVLFLDWLLLILVYTRNIHFKMLFLLKFRHFPSKGLEPSNCNNHLKTVLFMVPLGGSSQDLQVVSNSHVTNHAKAICKGNNHGY